MKLEIWYCTENWQSTFLSTFLKLWLDKAALIVIEPPIIRFSFIFVWSLSFITREFLKPELEGMMSSLHTGPSYADFMSYLRKWHDHISNPQSNELIIPYSFSELLQLDPELEWWVEITSISLWMVGHISKTWMEFEQNWSRRSSHSPTLSTGITAEPSPAWVGTLHKCLLPVCRVLSESDCDCTLASGIPLSITTGTTFCPFSSPLWLCWWLVYYLVVWPHALQSLYCTVAKTNYQDEWSI